jgi:hypothetical protein
LVVDQNLMTGKTLGVTEADAVPEMAAISPVVTMAMATTDALQLPRIRRFCIDYLWIGDALRQLPTIL